MEITTMQDAIKVRFTSNVRSTLTDLLTDEVNSQSENEGSKLALQTLEREKTNVVVQSEKEADAITYELQSMAEWIEQGHPVFTSASADACRRCVKEIEESRQE